MIKKIKLYFTMKKLERQMKYELLSKLYLFVTEKDKYLNLLHELAQLPPEEMKEQFIQAMADLTRDLGVKETEAG